MKDWLERLRDGGVHDERLPGEAFDDFDKLVARFFSDGKNISAKKRLHKRDIDYRHLPREHLELLLATQTDLAIDKIYEHISQYADKELLQPLITLIYEYQISSIDEYHDDMTDEIMLSLVSALGQVEKQHIREATIDIVQAAWRDIERMRLSLEENRRKLATGLMGLGSQS